MEHANATKVGRRWSLGEKVPAPLSPEASPDGVAEEVETLHVLVFVIVRRQPRVHEGEPINPY